MIASQCNVVADLTRSEDEPSKPKHLMLYHTNHSLFFAVSAMDVGDTTYPDDNVVNSKRSKGSAVLA